MQEEQKRLKQEIMAIKGKKGGNDKEDKEDKGSALDLSLAKYQHKRRDKNKPNENQVLSFCFFHSSLGFRRRFIILTKFIISYPIDIGQTISIQEESIIRCQERSL